MAYMIDIVSLNNSTANANSFAFDSLMLNFSSSMKNVSGSKLFLIADKNYCRLSNGLSYVEIQYTRPADYPVIEAVKNYPFMLSMFNKIEMSYKNNTGR